MNRRIPLLVTLTALVLGSELQAQDVEALGRVYGTTPPQAYFDELQADPDAFQFERGFRSRLGGPAAAGGAGGPAAILGPREGAVAGTFRFPVILGLFADSPETAPFPAAVIQQEFFDGPNSRFQTVPELYSEMSGGAVDLIGVALDWQRSQLTQVEVAGGNSGLSPSSARVGEYIVQILTQIDPAIDWGQFDNDGLDGIPNSGDDDGFVDVLTVIHPTRGAECGGADRDDVIWSHRWTLNPWIGGSWPSPTPSASANGGLIRVQDYTIQPVYACDTSELKINEIGVFAHEFGHGFGLPDLYATADNTNHGAAGKWDLMATGSWGCGLFDPARPCHMGAWSKDQLGWADVEVLAPGLDHGVLSLEPVELGVQVYRIDSGDGSGDYFLLENRQRIGSDVGLLNTGLLVWHIDPTVVANRWGQNSINNDPAHMGVWLRQADGQNRLAQSNGGRGDGGDPFPGTSGQSVFHAGSLPASVSHQGAATGLTLLDIAEVTGNVEFRALTRFQTITLRAEGGNGEGGIFKVGGAVPGAPEPFLSSAPFQVHEFEAAAGVDVSGGFRTGFTGWEDDSTDRVREFATGLDDAELVATYDTPQIRFDVVMEGPVAGIDPGTVLIEPGTSDGWASQGTPVTVTASPRTGFAFREWTGFLEGSPNPAVHTLDAPVTASAAFDLTYAIAETPGFIEIEAATQQEIVFEVANANLPVQWTLRLGSVPEGLLFRSEGLITGVPFEAGDFPLEIRVTDAIGLEATVGLTLRIEPPGLGAEDLAAPFLLQTGSMTSLQLDFLDRNGNDNGAFDLGDLRAFVIANPELPMTGEIRAFVRTIVPLADLGGKR